MDRNIAWARSSPAGSVALRKESVDRNNGRGGRCKPWYGVALRKESVDRNNVSANNHIRIREVALRKESVDRNTSFCLTSLCELPSLSARRAWIEIGLQCVPNSQKRVALRKESVDRNQKLQAAISGELGRSPQGERG